jgi:hypothetical protein
MFDDRVNVVYRRVVARQRAEKHHSDLSGQIHRLVPATVASAFEPEAFKQLGNLLNTEAKCACQLTRLPAAARCKAQGVGRCKAAILQLPLMAKKNPDRPPEQSNRLSDNFCTSVGRAKRSNTLNACANMSHPGPPTPALGGIRQTKTRRGSPPSRPRSCARTRSANGAPATSNEERTRPSASTVNPCPASTAPSSPPKARVGARSSRATPASAAHPFDEGASEPHDQRAEWLVAGNLCIHLDGLNRHRVVKD